MTESKPADGLDPTRWVTIDGIDGRCIIVGNGHTFPGRFLVLSGSVGLVSASKYEVLGVALDFFHATGRLPTEDEI